MTDNHSRETSAQPMRTGQQIIKPSHLRTSAHTHRQTITNNEPASHTQTIPETRALTAQTILNAGQLLTANIRYTTSSFAEHTNTVKSTQPKRQENL